MPSAEDGVSDPAAEEPALVRYYAGEISAEIALMHLLLGAGGLEPLRRRLAALAAAMPDSGAVRRLIRLANERRCGLDRASRLVEAGFAAAGSEGLHRDDALGAIRAQFDQAVAHSPEAAVALYSLGDFEILDRATAEIAAWLGQRGLLAPDCEVLDIGCGIGRIAGAIAPRIRSILGIDLSSGMIAEARQRCAGLANAAFLCCNGCDLTELSGRHFDLVLAVDSFPYLVAADPEIAARHIRDSAALLRRGGCIAIFNYSYSGDLEADRRRVERLAGAHRLRVERAGAQDFSLWDGAAFLLRKPA
ncbi:MAG: methyltransferase domain-containing protein [Alphaproteobacteria bacterium]|nr:methyltransferase domain-containing protein [Alphaproteobacteria bacterium]